MIRRGIGYNRTLSPSYLFKDNLKQFDNYLPGSNYVFLSTGSCAIKLAIRALKLTSKDKILLPSYLCPAGVLRPIQEEGINTEFFKVKKDLSIDINDIEKKISEDTKALFVIHYFGFPQNIEKISKLCKDNSLFLIEDCAHAFLSKNNEKLLGSFGDFSIFSFRKTLPVPDGALLACNNSYFITMKIKKINLLRSLYSIIETGVLTLEEIHNHLNLAPNILIGGMSHLSRKLIKIYDKPTVPSSIFQKLIYKFNLKEIISRKRDNFKYLLENLNIKDFEPLYTKLPDGVCPLWFPVLTENRDEVRKMLRKKGVVTPIFWGLPEEIDKIEFRNSWKISSQILSLPLGSISPIDVNYITEILKD